MDVNRVPTVQSGHVLDFEWLKEENTRTVERAYNLARLSAMCELDEGWDGYNSKCVSRDIIVFVAGILIRIGTQPELYPTSEGGIQLQFEKEDKTYMEIVFSQNTIIGMRVDEGDHQTAEFNDFDYDSVDEIIEYIEDFNIG